MPSVKKKQKLFMTQSYKISKQQQKTTTMIKRVSKCRTNQLFKFKHCWRFDFAEKRFRLS